MKSNMEREEKKIGKTKTKLRIDKEKNPKAKESMYKEKESKEMDDEELEILMSEWANVDEREPKEKESFVKKSEDKVEKDVKGKEKNTFRIEIALLREEKAGFPYDIDVYCYSENMFERKQIEKHRKDSGKVRAATPWMLNLYKKFEYNVCINVGEDTKELKTPFSHEVLKKCKMVHLGSISKHQLPKCTSSKGIEISLIEKENRSWANFLSKREPLRGKKKTLLICHDQSGK